MEWSIRLEMLLQLIEQTSTACIRIASRVSVHCTAIEIVIAVGVINEIQTRSLKVIVRLIVDAIAVRLKLSIEFQLLLRLVVDECISQESIVHNFKLTFPCLVQQIGMIPNLQKRLKPFHK